MLKIDQQGRDNKNLETGSLKQKLKWFRSKRQLIAAVFVLFFLSFSFPSNLNSGISGNEEMWYEMKILTLNEVLDLKKRLTDEVEIYIEENSFGSKLSAKRFIQLCKEQKFDIVLALSQAQIESHFGTRGVASRTNSVFNVGTFDNGTILYRYSHPDMSVSPYIYLVKRRYLLDDQKSSADLLKPSGFVNYKGARYASLKSYEYRVKGVYDKILRRTPIDSLWKEYNGINYIYAKELYSSIDRFYAIIK
jgi:hypothetical protein